MAPGILNGLSSPSSQTFTASPTHPSTTDPHPSSEQALLSTLSTSIYTFLQPPPSLHAASLVLAKRYLDPLASSISEIQAQRQQDARKKRKRGEEDIYGSNRLWRLKQVHLEGFGIDQVWEQARRILDASREEVERTLPDVLQELDGQAFDASVENGYPGKENGAKMVRFDEDGFEVDDSDVEDTEDELDAHLDGDEEGLKDGESGDEGALDGAYDGDIAMEDEEGLTDDMEAGEALGDEPQETFVPDKHGLNDGFFSIDDFNRQSEFLEQQDARGDPDGGAASDEEDIDWDADPVALTSAHINAPDGGEAEEEDDEDGPTFGNADLNAPDTDDEGLDDSDVDAPMEDMGGINNTNDIKYAEFFAPPPRKATKSTRMRALPKTQPLPSSRPGPRDDAELERTMSAVRRDLFEDDLSANEDSDPQSDVSPGDPRSRRSNHEKRQAKLAEEIRRLEAANVAKREWTLSGEARAADRPINSLLEEDLDFERTGKPVPVITNEVSEDIEALIKRRILAREFDEVIKRRPDSLNGPSADARRGRFELDNTKPQQSLAEMYEADHLRTVDPEGYVDKRDEKLKREHAEIERLWKDISGKLDALSSWHYKPKPPQASINVVADVPTISMEDARPSAGGDVGGASMLAPQEVYKPGEEGATGKGEVVLKSGVPVQREEMSREEKLRRRRRGKERIKKAGGVVDAKGGKDGQGRKAKEKKEVIGELKKGGVRVIGKKGEIRDVEGGAVKGQTVIKGGGSFKL
ncbi:U3 snoRNP protein [Hypocenomyce scalaris]|nr:U3 snoRNP protein [Hypocenomyce scalaris]